MKTPLVSIIIPIFNVSEYIEDCLDSVLNQTYSNLQILCIDDCSTDNSIRIVEKYQSDHRIQILRNTENFGLGATRNKGINYSLGEYLFFLDSDDLIYPNAIKTLVDSALLSGDDFTFGSVNAFLHKSNMNPVNTSLPSIDAVDQYIKNLNKSLTISPFEITVSNDKFFYALKLSCMACGKLYKTPFLKDNQIKFVEKKVRHEDNGFHIKCMSCSPKVVGISNYIYQYRIRSNSIMWEARKDENKKLEHLKLSLDDAVSFLNLKQAFDYPKIVKDVYWKLYARRNNLFIYYIGQYEKHIKLLGINIFKQSSNGKIVKTSILGIQIRKISLW